MAGPGICANPAEDDPDVMGLGGGDALTPDMLRRRSHSASPRNRRRRQTAGTSHGPATTVPVKGTSAMRTITERPGVVENTVAEPQVSVYVPRPGAGVRR